MARPFKTEIAELQGTLDWVISADITGIMACLERARYMPIAAVGSGGSLSAANHLARLQRSFHNRLSVAMTPYQFRTEPVAEGTHCWIFSAGGSNVDAVAAVMTACRSEMLAVNVVTTSRRSALSRHAQLDPAIRLHDLAIPSKKDGFLATNSLMAFCAVMTRAYLEMHGANEEWGATVSQLQRHVDGEDRNSWQRAALDVAHLQNLVVLHDKNTSLGAFDLESKLTEAGIANVQLADYRHFAHGRHHWLAKNGSSSGVLALVSAADQSLAQRTLRMLPSELQTAVIQTPGSGETSQLTSLLAAFCVTETLGSARGIDPGQPGVPEFGRKLYRLSLGKPRTRRRTEASVDRKASERITPNDASRRQASKEALAAAHRQFEANLVSTPLGGIVLDYDGTIVDTLDRFHPPRPEMAAELVRLLSCGMPIGIATGRGQSAGVGLRSVIPRKFWSSVIIGYYNGAVIRELGEALPAEMPDEPLSSLFQLHEALKRGDDALKVTLRQHQLTIEADGGLPEDRLWKHARALVDELGFGNLRVVCSSHSIDVLDQSASKLNVVDALVTRASVVNILRVGDRGRWPGNDHKLLCSSLGLSVDQVSPDLMTCWNLAPEGVRGSLASVHYLQSVAVDGKIGWLKLEDE